MAVITSLEVRRKRYASSYNSLPARRGRILRSILQDLNCTGGGTVTGTGTGSTTLCSCFKASIICSLMKKLKLIPNSVTDPPTRRINYSGGRRPPPPVMRRAGLIKIQIFRDFINQAGRPFSRLQNSG